MGSVKEKVAKGGKKFWQNLTRLQQIDEAEDEISSDEETTKNNKKQRKQKQRKQRSSCNKLWYLNQNKVKLRARQMKRSNVVNLKSLTLTPRSLRKRKMHGKRNGRKEVGPWTLTSITLKVQNLIYKVLKCLIHLAIS